MTVPAHVPFKPAEEARKPRADGEQSRERLRHAALLLFIEHGFARTSVREIAQAAGANVAAISYYFGDKAGLYRAVYNELCSDQGEQSLAFAQPGLSLRTALRRYYEHMLAPLHQGEQAGLMLRLWLREMAEPTGLWAEEIERGIKPEMLALVQLLCRHLRLDAANDNIHRLGIALASLAVQIIVGRDIVLAVTPQLLATPDAIATWTERLVAYAEALIAAESILIQQEKP